MKNPALIDAMRALAQNYNRIADAALEQVQALRHLAQPDSLVDEAMLAHGRLRAMALRCDELVGHLEGAR